MADEKEGPYKVVAKIVGSREMAYYSIVMQGKHDSFMTEVVPMAGTGETARHMCNLLNKDYKRAVDELALELGMPNDTTD